MGSPIVNAAKTARRDDDRRPSRHAMDADDLPAGAQLTVHALKTADGRSVTGYLFRRGGERTVVCAMHPREMVVRELHGAGNPQRRLRASGCMGPRTVGNDLRLEHETALLDLAAGQLFPARRRRASSTACCRARPAADRSPRSIASRRGCPVEQRIKHSPGGQADRPRQAESAVPSTA